MMKELTVYTSEGCPYCTVLKKQLKDAGIGYKEVNLMKDIDKFEEFKSRSGEKLALPLTCNENKCVSGSDIEKVKGLL